MELRLELVLLPISDVRPGQGVSVERVGFDLDVDSTERRRNRTFQPWGCQGLPVLKGVVCRAFVIDWAGFCSSGCG